MGTVAVASPNLCLAALSYHTAGALYLIIIWMSGGHLQGTMSKFTFKISQNPNGGGKCF